jgi:DNA polymerase II small subunit
VIPNEWILAAVKDAVSRGFEVSPAAVACLQEYVNRTTEEVAADGIIRAIIEVKMKSEGGGQLVTTITDEDVRSCMGKAFGEAVTRAQGPSYDSGEVKESEKSRVEVLEDPSEAMESVGTEGFESLFRSRYEKLVAILKQRPEASMLVKISELQKSKGELRVAGLVVSKKDTKMGAEVAIDDVTGKISAVAVDERVKSRISALALDECVMLRIESNGGRFYVKEVIEPDVPARVFSASRTPVYAVLTSDLHFGSKRFLGDAFQRFLDWLAGKRVKDEDEEFLRHLRYIVIAGDLVDGVGVFPNQEYELEEPSLIKQYEHVAEKLSNIPQDVEVLVVPGNHDSTRQSLPQPAVPKGYGEALYRLKNVKMLGNPCLVKLSGVSVLVYHGRSLDDVLAMTPGLSYQRPSEAMRVLLRARHLAPTFGSRTPVAPELEDRLVIDRVPDVFHAGHVHTIGCENYKGTLIVNSGTWQGQTSYQLNLGITPVVGVVPIVNLSCLDVVMKQFAVSDGVAV